MISFLLFTQFVLFLLSILLQQPKLLSAKMDCPNLEKVCNFCGCYLVKNSSRDITDKLKALYMDYFGRPVQTDPKCAPQKCCVSCSSNFFKGKEFLSFSIPMEWIKPTEHPIDCYSCQLSSLWNSTNFKKRKSIKLPSDCSAILPVKRADKRFKIKEESDDDDDDNPPDNPEEDIPPDNPEEYNRHQLEASSSGLSVATYPGSEQDKDYKKEHVPIPLTYEVLAAYFATHSGDVNTSVNRKDLASLLYQHNLLDQGVHVNDFIRPQESFLDFFTNMIPELYPNTAYCNNVDGLMAAIDVIYDPQEWRLFIDRCDKFLNVSLLHKGNYYHPVLILYSYDSLGENYNDLVQVLFIILLNYLFDSLFL